jgi:predicted metal-dependent HD superfamily phosphohydrolase
MFDQTRSLAAYPEEVELAIWFYDVMYDPRRSDNEEKSAAWAEAVIEQSGLSREIAERVRSLILATRHREDVTDRDAQLLADVDLSILGREYRKWFEARARANLEQAIARLGDL